MGVRRELRDNFFYGGVNQLQFVSLATVASPPPPWACVRGVRGVRALDRIVACVALTKRGEWRGGRCRGKRGVAFDYAHARAAR